MKPRDKDIFEAILNELERSNETNACYFSSVHEAYAVIKEEVDEFWDEVKKNSHDRNPVRLILELTQIAAMVVKALESPIFHEKGDRK